MAKNLLALILPLLFISLSVNAQDNIKILQYNLLYYGLYDDNVNCIEDNNNVTDKTEYLKTLINYAEPDIFGVNEITSTGSYHDHLLNNVFLLNGYENYARATVRGSYLTSQIFYNTRKLKLAQESWVAASPRYIYMYKFYYNSPDLLQGDTAYFYCAVAHLKAGSDPDEAATRAETTEDFMAHLGTLGAGNYLFMGDLNLYTDEEVAYQNLVNPDNTAIKFNDPANAEGEWHENSYFADYHTQSTIYSGDVCGSTGGLDDRFDFILASDYIINGSNKIEYNANSYATIGQDGDHFNDGVTYNGNSSVPADVLNALANNSDHLPVMLEMTVNQTPISVKELYSEKLDVKINNPVSEFLSINIYINELLKAKNLDINIYSMLGELVYSGKILTDNRNITYEIPVNYLNSGMYILNISEKNSLFYTKKIIKL